MGFYDDLAGCYDALTDSEIRCRLAQGFAEQLQRRYAPGSVLDVACGTGVYSLALCRLGMAVQGVDLSSAMLQQAERSAAAEGLPVTWVCAPMQELPDRVAGPFDTVLCMGNSIPHLLCDSDLDSALAGFVRRLSRGGTVILQLLNYDRVLAERERIVGVTRHGAEEYIRFYDFGDDVLAFNVLSIRWETGRTGDAVVREQHLSSTPLRPYRASELASALEALGADEVDVFGDLAFGAFDQRTSPTAMIVARFG